MHNNIEVATKYLFAATIVHCTIFISIPAITSIYKYTSSGGSPESFHRATPAETPFDWRTPMGYLGSWFLQNIMLYPSTAIFFIMMTSTAVFCLFIVCFVDELQEMLRQLNTDLLFAKHRKLTAQEKIEMNKNLTDIIRFYGKAREFTRLFSRTHNVTIFSYIVFSVTTFCNILFLFDKAVKDGVFGECLRLVWIAASLVGALYLVCYIGDHVTGRIENVGEAAYQVAWYILPSDKQRDLSMLFAASQNRIYIEGIAGARCTREIFMRIINKTISLFMVLREF